MSLSPAVGRLRRSWVFAGVGGVLLWRAAAFRWPSSLVVVPEGLQVPTALLGILFLACGTWAWLARPGRWTAVFLLYGLGGGVHWGGSIGAPVPGLELSLFFVYLAITVVADASLLHLALIYPRGGTLPRVGRIALYAPAALALLLALVAGIVPRPILEAIAGLLLLAANLYSMIGGGCFLARMFSVDGATRRAARLPLIASGIVIGSVVALLGAGGVLPGHPEAWNLVLGVIPVSLAIALVLHSPDLGRVASASGD